VAEAVVDLLEPVDVDDHHRALAAVAGGERDVAVQSAAEAAPVQQAGEGVVVGQVAQLSLGPLRPLEGTLEDRAIVAREPSQCVFDSRIALVGVLHRGHRISR
jgi:hypothetical protein